MATKISDAEKPEAKIKPILPFLIIFGPFLMVLGLHYPLIYAQFKRPDWLDYGIAIAGVFILAYGLTLMAWKQVALERRLDELERLKS